MGRIERVWKLVGIILGVLGLVSGGASWAFAYVMSERDRQVSELTEAVQDLETSIEKMRDQVSREGDRSEQDMKDVQIALRILEVRVGYASRVPVAIGAATPSASAAAWATRELTREPTLGPTREPTLGPTPEPETPASSPAPPSDLSAVLDRIRRRHPAPMAQTESNQ